ncbi:MAG: hypothetical protein JNL18_15200 [Planctomycetaceae bacterium]|nr:hypothetical protein [Planctomycetaceae bacterium]
MAILIGVDEAGYGPNYGPLAIAATAWRVEEGFRVQGSATGKKRESRGRSQQSAPPQRAGASSPPAPPAPSTSTNVCSPPPAACSIDLYKLLRKIVARTPQRSGTRLAIADSKQLYKPGLGLEQLERGVLAALVATSPEHANCVAHVKALLAATLADPHGRRFELDCHAGDELPLPLDALAEEICELAALLRKSCAASGVTLLAVRARLIYPAEFNELVDRHGTKGAALSHMTLALVREVVDASMKPRGTSTPAHTLPPDSCPLTPDSCSITLDKHGGRNRYAAILQHHFPDSWIEVIDEGRSASRYRWKHGAAPIEAIFRVGGEALLPTALASMTAKYHREVAMRAFNEFWTTRLPGLKPTAGYPNDAKRFREQISQLQRELKIDDRMIWRNR